MVEVKGSHNIYDPYTGKEARRYLFGLFVLHVADTGRNQVGPGFSWHLPGLIVPDEPSAGVFVNGIAYPASLPSMKSTPGLRR